MPCYDIDMSQTHNWVKCLNDSIAYIESHICDDITADDVARHAYMSSYHFQRAFSLLTGLTVGEYIRNRRLTLAGQELAHGGAKVIDVALRFGYDTPEAFNKAFVRFHGLSPSKAKRHGAQLRSFAPIIIKIIMEGGTFMEYRIEEKQAFEVVGISRPFNHQTSASGIPAFWGEFHDKGYSNLVKGVFGICYCADGDAPQGNFDYAIADPYTAGAPVPEGFKVLSIPAQTWAMFKCVGAMPDAIQSMWKRVYSEWLPASDYEIVQQSYDIEMYTEGDPNSADYVSEIWIPVKKK